MKLLYVRDVSYLVSIRVLYILSILPDQFIIPCPSGNYVFSVTLQSILCRLFSTPFHFLR